LFIGNLFENQSDFPQKEKVIYLPPDLLEAFNGYLELEMFAEA
jgi:hypothetical protein